MRILIILLFLCASSLNAIAQESFLRQVYTQAENDYNLGRIEQASTALLDNMKAFQEIGRASCRERV